LELSSAKIAKESIFSAIMSKYGFRNTLSIRFDVLEQQQTKKSQEILMVYSQTFFLLPSSQMRNHAN